MLFEISIDHFKQSTVKSEEYWKQEDRTDYRVEVDHEAKVILVIGRPTSQGVDWLDNFDFRVRDKTRKWFPSRNSPRVHNGFLRQYESVRKILLDLCYKYEDYAIRCTGYSLGGSWTQIFVQDCLHRWTNIEGKEDRDIKAIFYACGNPWRWLPKVYRKALKACTQFVINYWDPVTWMGLLRFKRYGKNVMIGKPWRLYPLQHHYNQIERALYERFNKQHHKRLREGD